MTAVIEKKITGYKVKSEEVAPPPTSIELMERPDNIQGKTYKIKPGDSDFAYYVTINDIVLDTGERRPYELFINTKDITHFQWVLLVTRLVSAIFRHGGNYLFILDEMKAVIDPKGGYFKKGAGFMPSLVADIGSVIEQHIKGLQ